jgi:hypothetical protein
MLSALFYPSVGKSAGSSNAAALPTSSSSSGAGAADANAVVAKTIAGNTNAQAPSAHASTTAAGSSPLSTAAPFSAAPVGTGVVMAELDALRDALCGLKKLATTLPVHALGAGDGDSDAPVNRTYILF